MPVTPFVQEIRIVPSAFRHFAETADPLRKVFYKSSRLPQPTFRVCWEFRSFENGKDVITSETSWQV